MSSLTQSFSQKTVSKKLLLGFLVAAVTVLIGAANVANAAAGSGYGGPTFNFHVDGHHNVINVVINYFFG